MFKMSQPKRRELSRLVRACVCEDNPNVHEGCLEKEITFVKAQNPTNIARSEYEGFMEYKCPLCKKGILFKDDFSKKKSFLVKLTEYFW